MLRSVKGNKKYIFKLISIGLFGIGGLLLAPVVMCNRYRFCRCRNIWISV